MTSTMTPATTAPKHYDLLIEQQPDGTYQASILGWHNCSVTATTEQEAIGLGKWLAGRSVHLCYNRHNGEQRHDLNNLQQRSR
jgi:hypothetical protein